MASENVEYAYNHLVRKAKNEFDTIMKSSTNKN